MQAKDIPEKPILDHLAKLDQVGYYGHPGAFLSEKDSEEDGQDGHYFMRQRNLLKRAFPEGTPIKLARAKM